MLTPKLFKFRTQEKSWEKIKYGCDTMKNVLGNRALQECELVKYVIRKVARPQTAIDLLLKSGR